MNMCRFIMLFAGVAWLAAVADSGLLPGGDFEWAAKGERAGGWRTSSEADWLTVPNGGEDGSAAIGVEGSGTNNCKWLSPPVTLEPNSLYGFSVRVKASGSGAFTIGTPTFTSTDHIGDTCGGWADKRLLVYSACGRNPYPETFRLGEYQYRGKMLFDNARVVRLKAEYAQQSGLTLGHGERIAGNRYVFNSQWINTYRPRPLHAYKRLSFKTDHFDAYGGASVVFRHELAGRSIKSAAVKVSAAPVKDGVIIEVSADGSQWTQLAAPTNFPADGLRLEVPASLFPVAKLLVRLKVAPRGQMRLLGYSFEGEIDGAPAYLAGSTRYVDESGNEFARVDAPSFYALGYGALLSVPNAPFAAWTALSGWKVPKDRPLPAARAESVRVAAAANEAEAVQIVLRPTLDLANAKVTCPDDLKPVKGSGLKMSAAIPASAVEVFRVGYVQVVRVNDTVGCVDDWPDTLLRQDSAPTKFTPAMLKRGENAPFWIRVTVPKGTPPGIFHGKLRISCCPQVGKASTYDVPFEVEVYGFELPDRMTIRTAFGLFTQAIDLYHRLNTPEERKTVYAMYYESLSKHHASLYDPTSVKWKVKWANGEPEIDWAAWDAAMEDMRSKYGFTDFRLPGLLGIGIGNGGAYYSGVVPGLGLKSDHPDYEKYEAKYLKVIEAHLKEKGWLKDAYVYCYDEPTESIDRSVKEGLSLVAKYAPGLNRLLTAPVRKTLIGGPNIWCPIARDLHVPGYEKRRAAGDRFWWYVCMLPKPPYPSLNIDHPGVDLRVWLWQSWHEKMEGILIWNTTCWTRKHAYPDPKHPQNPYLDTTAWSSGYPSIWGANGDGRFFYPPPQACAAFDEERDIGPVLEKPVESLRLEYIRDGIEDFEYFAILKRRDPANPLLKVPPEVSASPAEFSVDPIHMERHRAKLAHEISRLSVQALKHSQPQ